MPENITQEIIGLEKAYWTAMSQHDLEAAVRLTDFPCIVASSHGAARVDREQFERMFNSHEAESIRHFDFDESQAEVRQLGPDTAVIAYRIQSEVGKDGETRNFDAIDTSTWIRRGDRWVCAMHSEIEANSPEEPH